MNAGTKQTILFLRERASYYGLRAKAGQDRQADRDRAISRAYCADARSLESDATDDEASK